MKNDNERQDFVVRLTPPKEPDPVDDPSHDAPNMNDGSREPDEDASG